MERKFGWFLVNVGCLGKQGKIKNSQKTAKTGAFRAFLGWIWVRFGQKQVQKQQKSSLFIVRSS